jgi:hypothetical protein
MSSCGGGPPLKIIRAFLEVGEDADGAASQARINVVIYGRISGQRIRAPT